MKKLLSVSLCLLFAASLTAQTGKIRVATVGNSIRCGVGPRGAAGGAAGAGPRGLGERGSAVAHERRRRVHGLRDGSGDDTGSRGAGRTGGRHQRGAGFRPHDGAGYCAVAKKPMQLHRLFCCQFSFAR